MDNKIIAIIGKIKEFSEIKDSTSRLEIESIIKDLHASDQAVIISSLEESILSTFFIEFLYSLSADFLLFLESSELDSVIKIIGTEKTSYLISLLEIDDAVWLLSEIDNKNTVKDIIASVPSKVKIKIKRSLSYPEGSVGRTMSVDFLHVPYWWTVARTMRYLKDCRKVNNSHSDAREIFIVDESRKVLGTISILHLIEMEEADIVEKILKKNIISIRPQSMVEDMVKMFEQYELNISPVVDKMERIIGVLEFSHIAEYIKEKSESDALHKAGVFDAKTDTVFGIAKVRFIWLFINLLTAIFASYFVSLFEDSFKTLAVLAVLMPITASMGGNCGTQSSTVMITNIANGRMNKKHIKSEIQIALLNGIAFSMVCFSGIYLIYHNLLLALAFGLSIMITICCAGIVGAFIPVWLDKLNFDPAVSATIFVTTITDITGFFTFLWLSKLFLI